MFGWKERRSRRCTHEYHVRVSDMLLEQPIIFSIVSTQCAKAEFAIGIPQVCPFLRFVDISHQGLRSGKRAIDHIDMMDFRTSQQESESYVPISLLTSAEDGNGVNPGTFGEQEGRS